MSEQPMPRVPRPRRARFVTLCQQMLALGVVVAVLTPAARTVTMDVRPMPLGGSAATTDATMTAAQAAYVHASIAPSRVPTAPVNADITSYALTAPHGARLAPGALRARTRRTATGRTEITTGALPVTGYGAVGVTWQPGVTVARTAIKLKARSRTAGRWSRWTNIDYDDDHGPDPGTAEARHERPGTELLFVGEVDQVQVRVDTRHAAPADMRLAVVNPGKATHTKMERAALDTSRLDGTPGDEQALLRKDPDGADGATADQTAALAAAGVTPKPQIYSRAQWGANEKLRDKSSLHYGQVHAGFIHHTVQANDYTRAQVPGLIRADYQYHTQTRGWSDIGYNYLIDRFGRIWEGRYGGVDRDPVGAHTLGYNDDSFAASAIGNYQIKKPSNAMVQAYAALFAWKLSLAGVKANATHQWVTKRYFNAINGHRDAGQTLCPGKYLYNKIPYIRTTATKIQASWAERQLSSNLGGSAGPDLIARRTSDGEGFVLPINVDADGNPKLGTPIDTRINLTGVTTLLKVGDWNGDGFGDVVVRRKADPANLYLYRGTGKGTFAAPVLLTSAMKGVQMLAAAGDFTGDGHPDLMGETKTGSMQVYPGAGGTALGAPYPVYAHIPVRKQMGVGRWDSDGAPDMLVRTTNAQLSIYYGNGPGGLTGRKALQVNASAYNQLVAVSSANADGHTDLVVRDRNGKMWVLPGTTSTKLRTPVPIGFAKGYNLFG